MIGALLLALFAAAPADVPLDATARALAAFREGRCPEALPLLARALEREPANATLRKLQGSCHLRAGLAAEAKADFEAVLAAHPEDGDAREGRLQAQSLLQGREQQRQGLVLESRANADRRLQTSHDQRRAEGLIAAGRNAEAQALLEQVTARDPDFLPASERLAELYSAGRRFTDAARLLRFLHERQPGRDDLLLRQARNLEWAEEVPESIECFRRYLARRPGDVDARLALADVLRQFGLCHEGLPEYQRLAAAKPRSARIRLGIALCEDQLDHADRAIEAFLAVLEVDPKNEIALKTRARRAKEFEELPRRKAYAAIEAGDLGAAAGYLEQYVEAHPASDDALRELAEVLSWAERYAEAEARYRAYLARVPDDYLAVRSLARVQSWGGDLAAARASYEALLATGHARAADYEELVRVLTWAGETDAAEPFARRLLELDAANPAAQALVTELQAARAVAALREAEQLEQARRFSEAAAAYQGYLARHGEDAAIELRLCDLRSWAGDHAAAAAAYRGYLDRHPADLSARIGLANSLRWKGEPAAAAAEYSAVLAASPGDVPALLGLAQSLGETGRDPYRVLELYQQALAHDAENEVARRGVADARRLVAPEPGVSQSTLLDSDDLEATTLEAGVTFTRPGFLRLTPQYRFARYSQLRTISGDEPALEALNGLIAARAGTWTAHGAALRAEAGAGQRLHAVADAGFLAWDAGRTSFEGRLQATLAAGAANRVSVTAHQGDAVPELRTVASLAAGVTDSAGGLEFELKLPAGFRAWGAGQLDWYSGSSTQAPGFQANRQYRFAGRLDHGLGSAVRLGYAFRQTGFDERSPLYFSPGLYRVHSLWSSLSAQGPRFGFSLDGEAGLADIDGADSSEWAVAAALNARLGSRVRINGSYRYSRSEAGLEQGRPYRAQQFAVGLEGGF